MGYGVEVWWWKERKGMEKLQDDEEKLKEGGGSGLARVCLEKIKRRMEKGKWFY